MMNLHIQSWLAKALDNAWRQATERTYVKDNLLAIVSFGAVLSIWKVAENNFNQTLLHRFSNTADNLHELNDWKF